MSNRKHQIIEMSTKYNIVILLGLILITFSLRELQNITIIRKSPGVFVMLLKSPSKDRNIIIISRNINITVLPKHYQFLFFFLLIQKPKRIKGAKQCTGFCFQWRESFHVKVSFSLSINHFAGAQKSFNKLKLSAVYLN